MFLTVVVSLFICNLLLKGPIPKIKSQLLLDLPDHKVNLIRFLINFKVKIVINANHRTGRSQDHIFKLWQLVRRRHRLFVQVKVVQRFLV
jgi:hypothetical protein